MNNDERMITAPKQAPDTIENEAAHSECPAANPVNIESEQELCLSDIIKQPTPLLKELLLYLHSDDETARNQAGDQPIDLYHLFTELATMKTELKYASRQMKTGLEELKQVFSTLQQCNTRLTAELEQCATREQQQIDVQKEAITLKPLLLHLIDLHASVERSLLSLTCYKPGLIVRIFAKRERRFLLSQQQGQRMLLSRIEQYLAGHHVQAINTTNQAFDAKTMCAVGLKTDKRQPQGTVLEEVRKGYLWNEKLLRQSEVIVNKWDEQR